MGRLGSLPRPPSPVSLSRQLIFPDLVEGLVLINIDPNGKGWIDWAATKVSAVRLEWVGGRVGRGGAWRPVPHTGSASARSSPA